MAEAVAPEGHVSLRTITLSWRGTLGALLLVWLFCAVLISNKDVGFSDYRTRHLVFGTLLVAYGVLLLLRRRLPGPTVFDFAIASVLLVNAVAIFFSPDRVVSLEATLEIMAVVIVFYALVDARSIDLDHLLGILLVIVTCLGTLGILSFGVRNLQWLQLKQTVLPSMTISDWSPRWYRPTVFYHPNILAAALNLALPFSIALTFWGGTHRQRWLAGASFTICMGALILTNSRGAWLGFLVGSSVFAFCCLHRSSDLRFMLRLWWKSTRSVSSRVALLLIVLGSALLSGLAWHLHPAWMFRATAGARFELAEAALKLTWERPLLGYGPRTSLGLFFPSYHLNHPHNQFLDILLGSGIIGVAAAAILAWTSARVLISALDQRQPRERAIGAACIAAATATLVHGLVDVPFHAPGLVLLTALVAAIALRLSHIQPSTKTAASCAARGLIVAILPVCLIAWSFSDSAQSHYAASLTLSEQGHVSDAAEQAGLAVAKSPDSTAYQLNAGILEALAYQASPTTSQQEEHLQRSISYLEKASALDKNAPVVYANLAQILRIHGDKDAAARSAEKAIAKIPYNQFLRGLDDPSILILSGSILDWAGHDPEAVTAYAEAMKLEPSVAASPYWDSSQEAATLLDEAIDQSGVSPCIIGRSVGLYNRSSAALSSLARLCQQEAKTADDQAALAIMLEAEGMHFEALQEAQTAAKLSASPAVHTALGFVLSGDNIDQARRELLQGDKDGLLLLAITYETGAQSRVPSIAHSSDPLPIELEKAIEHAIQEEPSAVGFSYYEYQLRRTPPSTTLIPGDWQEIISPRVVLEQRIVASFKK